MRIQTTLPQIETDLEITRMKCSKDRYSTLNISALTVSFMASSHFDLCCIPRKWLLFRCSALRLHVKTCLYSKVELIFFA